MKALKDLKDFRVSTDQSMTFADTKPMDIVSIGIDKFVVLGPLRGIEPPSYDVLNWNEDKGRWEKYSFSGETRCLWQGKIMPSP